MRVMVAARLPTQLLVFWDMQGTRLVLSCVMSLKGDWATVDMCTMNRQTHKATRVHLHTHACMNKQHCTCSRTVIYMHVSAAAQPIQCTTHV